jgi:hypothetical protein
MYRGDGLTLIQSTSGRLADKAKKDLCAQFLQFGLRITAEVNHQLVNFLDVTFNRKDGSYSPYRKPDNNPLYIDKRSNHQTSITNHLLASINRRISSLSSSKLAFDYESNVYEAALHKSNYNGKLEYSPDNPPTTTTQKRKRQRNIIWFNPSSSKNVRSNIARDFLQLIDKHFPKANPLHEIFNRNSIKVSYTAAWKVLEVLFQTKQARPMARAEPIESPSKFCDCQIPCECQLQKKCLTKGRVYKAVIKTKEDRETKEYIEMTANDFKVRYRNHMKSFKHNKYEYDTELSKYV